MHRAAPCAYGEAWAVQCGRCSVRGAARAAKCARGGVLVRKSGGVNLIRVCNRRLWWRVRAAEGTRLESECCVKATEGSNPSATAKIFLPRAVSGMRSRDGARFCVCSGVLGYTVGCAWVGSGRDGARNGCGRAGMGGEGAWLGATGQGDVPNSSS